MRHGIDILQDEQHRLARLHGERLLVVGHPLIDGADFHHPHAEVGEHLPTGCPLGRRQERGEIFCKLPGSEAGIARPLLRRGLLHPIDERVEQRRGLFGRPLRHWNRGQCANRGVAIARLLHERRDLLESLRLAATNARQREEGGSPHRDIDPVGFADERKLGGQRWRGLLVQLEHLDAILVEHLEREVLETPAKRPLTVIDHDPLNPLVAAKIDLPPGVVRALGGVRLASLLPGRTGIPVDRTAGIAAVGRIDLRGLTLAGHVGRTGKHLHLGERKRLLASQLDPHEPAQRARHLAFLTQLSIEQRQNPLVEARPYGRIADQR